MPHPFVDLSGPIIGCLGGVDAITVRTYPAGSYSASTGKWTQGTPTDTATDAVVQPSTPKEIEQLPENERTKEAITVFTDLALKTSDVDTSGESDVILWGGRQWKVMISEDWNVQAGYARAVCTRIGE